jgi:flagellar assembly protein FliH
MLSRARRVGQPAEPFDWNALATRSVPQAAVAGGSADATPATPSDDQQRRQRLAAAERDGFARGYAEGERAGAEVGAQRAEAMLRRLTQTIEELSGLRNEVLRGAEHQVLRLAMAIARRILDRELHVDRGMLLAMARVALDRLGDRSSATIRLHPDDNAAILARRVDENAAGPVQIVADPLIGRGGCIVQSDFGLVEVGLDAQFAELSRALLGESDDVSVREQGSHTHGNGDRV